MKRYITILAAAALVACSNEELSTPENNLATSEAPVNFEAYTQRGLTRAGARGDIDNNNITGIGFGVFGYYTAGATYDQKATPNFMYNERVSNSGSGWAYEPVKYWPNEYGSNAKSEEVDRLSFFAYAPWTEVDPTTGNVLGDPNHDIVSVNKHGATGDPLVKYVVDTDPATSVDLLWGVAADNPANYYKAIQGTVDITTGKPFIDLVKPNDPANDKLSFNLKHALAKVKVTIDFIADAETPDGTSQTIYPEETRIYVRNFKMSGFALQGALNLNNTTADKPLWKDFDGAADLAFDEVIFQDGRKDGKEGETNGAQTNETPQGLNPEIVENFCQTTTANGVTVFGANKKQGVTNETKLLFGGSETENGGYFYVIPRNEGTGVDIEIAYDVETIDRKLVGKLSDNETHGISIENVISKEKIFGDGVDFEPGKAYEIKIHIGMTSMKVDAEVTAWTDNGSTNVNLPDNQNGNGGNGGNTGGNTQQTYPYWTIGTDDTKYYTDPTNISPTYYYVKDATSWRNAIEAGPLAAYYDDNPTEAKAADDDPTLLDINSGFVYIDHTTGNKHTWYAEVKAPKAGLANNLPWIVIDMNYTPAFEGTIHMKYNGTDSTPWGTNWNKPGRKWAVCAVSDPDFVNGTISPYTGYDSYTYGGTLTGTDFVPDLLEVTLERGNVTKHEQ